MDREKLLKILKEAHEMAQPYSPFLKPEDKKEIDAFHAGINWVETLFIKYEILK